MRGREPGLFLARLGHAGGFLEDGVEGRPVQQASVRDNGPDSPGVGDIGGGVGVEQHHVGQLARRDGAQAVGYAQAFGGGLRGRDQHLRRGHAELGDQGLELVVQAKPRKHQHARQVRPGQNPRPRTVHVPQLRDALGQERLPVRGIVLVQRELHSPKVQQWPGHNPHTLVALPFSSFHLGHDAGGRADAPQLESECRHQPSGFAGKRLKRVFSLCSGQAGERFSQEIGVLQGPQAGVRGLQKAHLHRHRVVAGDAKAQFQGLGQDGEVRLSRSVADLYESGARIGQLLQCLGNALRTLYRQPRAFNHRQDWKAGHLLDLAQPLHEPGTFDARTGGLDAGAEERSVGYPLATVVDLAQPAAHVPHAGDAVGDEQRQSRFARVGKVDMHVKETWDKVPVRGVNDHAAFDPVRGLGRPDVVDLIAVDDHGHVGLGRATGAVNKGRVFDDDACRWRWRHMTPLSRP